MAERDTRQTIDEEEKYLYFDVAIEPYLQGESTLAESLATYHMYIGGLLTPPQPGVA